jgi:8-amino-7-oxononanoate synthase
MNEKNQNKQPGSRLLSGNHKLYQETEVFVPVSYRNCIIFNSSYDAMRWFFWINSTKGILILYDDVSCYSGRN